MAAAHLNLMSPLPFQTSTGQIQATNDVTGATWLYPHPVICWLNSQTAGGATFWSISTTPEQEEVEIKDTVRASTTEFKSKSRKICPQVTPLSLRAQTAHIFFLFLSINFYTAGHTHSPHSCSGSPAFPLFSLCLLLLYSLISI